MRSVAVVRLQIASFHTCTNKVFFIAGTLLLLNFQPSSKKYFEDFCGSQENAEVEFMRQLFNERSILFLGCDPNREEYINFFRKFAVSTQVNYASFPNELYHTTGYLSFPEIETIDATTQIIP